MEVRAPTPNLSTETARLHQFIGNQFLRSLGARLYPLPGRKNQSPAKIAAFAEAQWAAAGAQLEKTRKLVLLNLVLGVLIVCAVKLV